MSAIGTSRTSGDVRLESEKRSKADIEQTSPTATCENQTAGGARMLFEDFRTADVAADRLDRTVA